MFWGATIKSGEILRSTQIFEDMEFPALHVSQVVLDEPAGNVKVQVKMAKQDTPIIVAILNKHHPSLPLNTYFNMT